MSSAWKNLRRDLQWLASAASVVSTVVRSRLLCHCVQLTSLKQLVFRAGYNGDDHALSMHATTDLVLCLISIINMLLMRYHIYHAVLPVVLSLSLGFGFLHDS